MDSCSETPTKLETPFSRPALKIIHTSHGFCGPYPDFSEGHTGERISGEGCAPVVKISPNLVVKYGPHVKVTEAESLLFIESKAPSILAPRLHACYTIGPFDRDPDDFGSVYDTYIIMTFIEGQRLDKVWEDLNETSKRSIAAQLRIHMQDLRSISRDALSDSTIESVANGPLQEPLFAYHTSQGPFVIEQDFNAALVSVHEAAFSKAHLRLHIEGALAQHKHNIVLTHGDLAGRNIMVIGERISGLIDWETCGWYPEYWEFAKCFTVAGWPKEWPVFVSQVLQPYFCEWVVYDLIKRHVW